MHSRCSENQKTKERECFKQYFFTISGKIFKRLFNVDPWFRKTTLTFSFFFDPTRIQTQGDAFEATINVKFSGY